MSKNIIDFDEVQLAEIKKILKKKGKKANAQNCVDYAFSVIINANKIFDEETLELINL
jgi:hypothetical protein